MKYTTLSAACLFALIGSGTIARSETITIATVNNADMIIMQKLAHKWEEQTGNKINWDVLEENVLRQRVTTDIATRGGQFDIITIGAYETPLWAKRGWLDPLNGLKDYDYADILAPVSASLSYKGKLYAVPFYAESSFTLYRKDLFQQAGLTMPEQPTWTQIRQFADKLTDRGKGQYGICLRGKPGWGENMALVGTVVNSFGGRWFNMKWQPQIDTQAWKNAINFYVDLMKADGPPGATSNGGNEVAALFATGKCAVWVDATSNAGRVFDPKQSEVYDKTAVALAPEQVTRRGAAWAWSWALAIPATTKKEAVAKDFVRWATSKDYVALVGDNFGWVAVPPGTRKSTYDNPKYQSAASFAPIVLNAIMSADPTHPTKDPVPYLGIQFVDITQFQSIGTAVGQDVAAALNGQMTVDAALEKAQRQTAHTMQHAGYMR